MNYFNTTMRNMLSSNAGDSNILETARHTKPVFEKIVPSRYFSIKVNTYL